MHGVPASQACCEHPPAKHSRIVTDRPKEVPENSFDYASPTMCLKDVPTHTSACVHRHRFLAKNLSAKGCLNENEYWGLRASEGRHTETILTEN